MTTQEAQAKVEQAKAIIHRIYTESFTARTAREALEQIAEEAKARIDDLAGHPGAGE